jgi:prepilin signal peptidase PulO-like enzyme (type II secretory pathway)
MTNYFADVLPLLRRFSKPACAHCGAPYAWGNYLSVGACPVCGHRRGFRPWLVLAGMLGLSLYSWLQPHRMGYALSVVLLTYFAVVVVIDLEHRLILRPTSVVGALLAPGIGWWLHGVLSTALGGLAGVVIMGIFYYFGVLFSRLRNRRLRISGQPVDEEEALGGGDVMLAGILGLLLGWPLIWLGLLLGILIGGVVGLVVVLTALLRGRYGRQALMLFMPYGPAFILSAFAILFVPQWISGLLPK